MSVSGNTFAAEVQSLGKQSGNRYVYGGDSVSTGFDCSGLIYAALLAEGVSNPPRTSEAQYAASTKVSASNLAVGDLVFAQFPGDNASPGHVGVYIGNGEVYAAADQASGIGPSSLSSWGSNIVGYGAPPGVNPSGSSGSPASTTPTSTTPTSGNILTNTAVSAFESLLAAFGITPTSIEDMLERLGLMIVGLITIFMGIKIFTSTSITTSPSAVSKQFKSHPSEAADAAEVAEVAA